MEIEIKMEGPVGALCTVLSITASRLHQTGRVLYYGLTLWISTMSTMVWYDAPVVCVNIA